MKWVRFLLLTSIVAALLGIQPQRALADVTLSPTDDTFVRDLVGQQDSNFDEYVDELLVTSAGFPSGVPVDIGYLRFDVSGASTAVDVELRLYNQASPGHLVTVGLYSTADDDWNGGTAGLGDETTLTFNNAPGEVSLLDSQSGAAIPAWMEFSSAALTTYVNDQIAGDGTVTLRVRVTTTGIADVNFFEDRENGGGTGFTPQLEIYTAHDHWGESWSGSGTGLTLSSTGQRGVFGRSYATTATYGVYGQSDSDGGIGVFGQAPSNATSTWAVYGRSDSPGGIGLRGDATAPTGPAIGVLGISDHTPGRAVFGRADAASGTTYGVYGQSDSEAGVGALGYARATSGNVTGVWGRTRSPDSWVGEFTGNGNGIYVSVPAGKQGLNVANGSKNAVVATEDGARLLYAEEATEVWFADYGFGQLEKGVARVALDPIYAQTVDHAREYDVSVQAYGDAELYVSARTPKGFVVRSSAGDPTATFSYRVTAKRLGHEDARLERATWADDDPNLFPELVSEVEQWEDSLLEGDPLEVELEEEERDAPPEDPIPGEIVPGQEGAQGDLIAGGVQVGGGVASPEDRTSTLAVHDHWGETWTGTGTGLTVISTTGDGMRGISTAPTGATYGVYGICQSARARAVLGVATATSGNTIGVLGQSDSTDGTGVVGHSLGSTGVSFGVYAFNRSNAGVGAYGHASSPTGPTTGVLGESHSSLGRGIYGYAAALTGVTYGIRGHVDSPNGWAGYFSSGVGHGVYVSVPANKTGLDVASGTKNAVVATEDGARLMYAEEATEVWFADYGVAKLKGGVARVQIDGTYAQTVNLEQPYHVFLQAYGDADLYVSERTAEAFEVRAREGGRNARFFYRIVAKRAGHEERRLERAPWADDDPNLYPGGSAPEQVRKDPLVAPRPDQRERERGDASEDAANEGDVPTLADPDGTALAVSHDHWGELWTGSGADGLTLTSSDGNALVGESTEPLIVAYGVYGLNRSTSGVGVTGYASSPSGNTTGVTGSSQGARGAFGYATATSGSTYAAYGHSASDEGIGLAGSSTPATGGNYGIWGWARSTDGTAVYGYASHPSGNTVGVRGQTDSPNGWAAKFTSVYGNGVHVSVPAGNAGLDVAGGTKNAVVATEDGARLLYAEEATEVWFADYGFGQLQDGVAQVTIDPIYAQTVNLEQPYHVFVQVYGDARLSVFERTAQGFEVRLLSDGSSVGDPNAAFSYRVVAKRLGQEGYRLERAPWADDDPNLFPDLMLDPGDLNGFDVDLGSSERRPIVGDKDGGD